MLKDNGGRQNAKNGLRAVVVEDDAFVLATIEMRLAKRDVETVGFGAISPARDYLQRQKVDFAIIDLGLPDGDGLELLKFIRQTPLNKEIPIIIATANRSDTLLKDVLGPDRAIFVSQKPIDWACLQYVLDGTVLQQIENAG